MEPDTDNSPRRLVRAGLLGIALAAAIAVAITQFLLDDGQARCVGPCKPPPFSRWSYQLQERPRIVNARVYDVDGFDTSAFFVSRLHKLKLYAICYIDVGTWEDWRPDRQRFPDSVLGRSNGWPGERWLDIRRTDVLIPIMRERIRMCRQKGFDAVEPDNVDGYTNDTGFPLTAADQLRYNRRIALLAHSSHMAVGLKNDLDQAAALRDVFDFAVVEQCFQYDECDKVKPFTNARKPVFEVEYSLPRSQFCAEAKALKIRALEAPVDLDRPGTPC
jgi:hypothetical protein